MNTREILETLEKLFANFVFHNLFLKELGKLLKQDLRGKEKEFFNCLTTQLDNIRTFGILVAKTDDNEKLKGADGHYFSIHMQRKQFNIRFIVYIQDDGFPYFLCAFNEKSGKRISDYSSYTAVMTKRFKELKEEQSHE